MGNLVTALILALLGAAGAADWVFFDGAALTWVGKTLLDVIDWLAFWH